MDSGREIELVFCSANQHKADEMRSLLPAWIRLKTMRDIGLVTDIPETGCSFAENALIKSRFVYEKTNRMVFSDDSGLEVDCLNGSPGIHTARYAGQGATSIQNVSKLLIEMMGCENRKARFVCCLSLIIGGKEFVFQDVVDGVIAMAPSGGAGFGYDPVFIPDGYSHTFAELTNEVKNQISHRAKAVRQMVHCLEGFGG
jgi:XTP/dITP diphosphohydrolase